MKIISPVAVGLAVMCVFLLSVPSYAEPIHLELEADHNEVLYLSAEEIEGLIFGELSETDPEVVYALGSGAVMVGAVLLPAALGKVLPAVRSLGGSGGKKMVLVLGVASATLGSFLKIQGEEDFLDLAQKKSLFPAEEGGAEWEGQPDPKNKLIPPLEISENDTDFPSMADLSPELALQVQTHLGSLREYLGGEGKSRSGFESAVNAALEDLGDEQAGEVLQDGVSEMLLLEEAASVLDRVKSGDEKTISLEEVMRNRKLAVRSAADAVRDELAVLGISEEDVSEAVLWAREKIKAERESLEDAALNELVDKRLQDGAQPIRVNFEDL